MQSGIYIKRRFNRCQRPSFAITVEAKFSLSDIINKTKRKRQNPIADPMPWIFDATVVIFLVSFTLKKLVKMHAPIAKTEIMISNTTVNFGEVDLK